MADVISILKKVGALVENSHFVGTSGRHMPAYINKDLLLSNPKYASMIGKLFAEKFKNKNIEVVVAPAVAGIALGQWTAWHLSKIGKREVLSVFTEKTPDNNQILKRGFGSIVSNKRILIIEDIVTTGSSIKKVARCVKDNGGKIVSACSIINRDPNQANSKSLGIPFLALEVIHIPSYEPRRCPLCKTGIPMNTKLGHGKNFLTNT